MKALFITMVLMLPGIACAEVSPNAESGTPLCSKEANTLQLALDSLGATEEPSEKEDLQEIHESFHWLLETLKEDRPSAKYARMELDVRLEALRARHPRHEQSVKDLHGFIVRFMKCQGIKPPLNGKKVS